MKCPKCRTEGKSRAVNVNYNLLGVRRRRQCNVCKYLFCTQEIVVLSMDDLERVKEKTEHGQ